MKNNTSILSCLQGKSLMVRSWKLAGRQGNYWTSNLKLFVIWKKSSLSPWRYSKNPTVGSNNAIKIFTDKFHAKCNTNMLSDPQDKLLMARSWKLVRKNIKPPFYLKEIALTTMKIQQKSSSEQYLRDLRNKNRLPAPVAHKPLRWPIWELLPGKIT